MSLAHCGVLFLDELPEFDRHALEVLRQPLESGHISISRAARQADFPARFQLLAAMNPCACGYHGYDEARCRCTPEAVARYQQRISGPLLDRFDMQVSVAALAPDMLAALADGEPSSLIAARVARAHARAHARQQTSNQGLGTHELDRHCRLTPDARARLRESMLQFQWSARAYHRVLKVARTVADLAGTAEISCDNVGEAIQFRRGLIH